MLPWSTDPQALLFQSAPLYSVKMITLEHYYDINANEINSHNSTQKRQLTQLTQFMKLTQLNATQWDSHKSSPHDGAYPRP